MLATTSRSLLSKSSSRAGRYRIGIGQFPDAFTSGQRPNILVHAEEVLRIVLRLELLEAPVVGSICGGDRIARLVVIQVVHVPAGGDEGLHLRIGLSRPGDARVGIGRIRPLGENEEVIPVRA